MKIRMLIPKGIFSVVNENDQQIAIEITGHNYFNADFVEDSDIIDNDKLIDLMLLQNGPKYKLNASDIKSSIDCYLNSVPSQEDIANYVGTPSSMFKTNMQEFIDNLDVLLKKDKPDFLDEYGFIKGRDAMKEEQATEETPTTSIFWYTDKEFGWKKYIDMHRYSQQFMRVEGVYNFVRDLEKRESVNQK